MSEHHNATGGTTTRDDVFTSNVAHLSAGRIRAGIARVNSGDAGAAVLAAALWGALEPPWWHRYARCRGMTELFDDPAWSTTARRLCNACPVRRQCRADQLGWEAVSAGRTHRAGVATVRGGMTASERAGHHAETAEQRKEATNHDQAATKAAG